MQDLTQLDAIFDRLQLNDDVVWLRPWATEHGHVLPAPSGKEWIIGSHETAWLRIQDSLGRVSRQHGLLFHRSGKWGLRDCASTNGMIVHGQRVPEVMLEPGMEIRLGGITMIAESGRSLALRAFLRRLLGWSSDRLHAVDLALRSIRIATTREASLVLCGEDDIISLARALHRHALGTERPFVLCDPRREEADENVRAVGNYQKGMDAVRAAKNGSLVYWDKQPPRDFVDVKHALRNPDACVMLIVCTRQASDAEALGAVPIVIPSLARRTSELPQIVDEYAHDAEAEFGLAHAQFPPAYRDWIVANEAVSLAHIEKATLRLLALAEAEGNTTRAAKLLGMARWSLAKWIGRRQLPMIVQDPSSE